MSDRQKILLGMAAGAVWALVVVWIGVNLIDFPVYSLQFVAPFFLFAPGLVILAIIGVLAARRMFDDDLINGAAPPLGSRAEIDQKVLKNTIEQAVLAACLWPGISMLLLINGPGLILALSVSFAIARVFFWVGYHLSPPLRAFGFAATLYPTLVALAWSGLWWAFI